MDFNSIGMSCMCKAYMYIILYSVSRKLKYRFIITAVCSSVCSAERLQLSRHIVPVYNVYNAGR